MTSLQTVGNWHTFISSIIASLLNIVATPMMIDYLHCQNTSCTLCVGEDRDLKNPLQLMHSGVVSESILRCLKQNVSIPLVRNNFENRIRPFHSQNDYMQALQMYIGLKNRKQPSTSASCFDSFEYHWYNTTQHQISWPALHTLYDMYTVTGTNPHIE